MTETATETIPAFQQTSETPSGGDDFRNSIPEEYKEKAYLKDVGSIDDLYKQFDNAQQLIGKKAFAPPGENATPEELNDFYKSIGRPETADLYEFDDSMLPEGQERDPEIASKVKAILHEAGLSSAQAKLIQGKYDTLIQEMNAPMSQEAMENEFDELANKHFGSDADKVFDNAQKLINAHIKPELKEQFKNMGNADMMVVASILDSVSKKHISEDRATEIGGGVGNSGLREKAQALIASDAYSNAFHKDHDRVTAEVKQLYKQISPSQN